MSRWERIRREMKGRVGEEEIDEKEEGRWREGRRMVKEGEERGERMAGRVR